MNRDPRNIQTGAVVEEVVPHTHTLAEISGLLGALNNRTRGVSVSDALANFVRLNNTATDISIRVQTGTYQAQGTQASQAHGWPENGVSGDVWYALSLTHGPKTEYRALQFARKVGAGPLWVRTVARGTATGATHAAAPWETVVGEVFPIGERVDAIPEETATALPDGLRVVRAYSGNTGWPETYGDVIQIGGDGDVELFLGWSPLDADATHGKVGRIWYRSRRNLGSNWSKWFRIPTLEEDGGLAVTTLTASSDVKVGYMKLVSGSNAFVLQNEEVGHTFFLYVNDTIFKYGSYDVWHEGNIDPVPTARVITAGAGLTGGGTLAANRTLAVNFGSSAGTVAEGNHTHGNYVTKTDSAPDIAVRVDSGFHSAQYPGPLYGWPESSSWYHLITNTHGDTANYYSMQFAADYFDSRDLFFRCTANSGIAAWHRVWHSGNVVTGVGISTAVGANWTTIYADFGTTAGKVAEGDHLHTGVYAPVSHTQAISTITGLQSALDAKYGSGATANFASVWSAGDITGNGGVNVQGTVHSDTALTTNGSLTVLGGGISAASTTGTLGLSASGGANGSFITFYGGNHASLPGNAEIYLDVGGSNSNRGVFALGTHSHGTVYTRRLTLDPTGNLTLLTGTLTIQNGDLYLPAGYVFSGAGSIGLQCTTPGSNCYINATPANLFYSGTGGAKIVIHAANIGEYAALLGHSQAAATISDSTATGRAVLTGTAAEGRSALSVPSASGAGASGTWDIGITGTAALASKLVNVGTVAAHDGAGGTHLPDGLVLSRVYGNGYPCTYGNRLGLGGGGDNELVFEWKTDATPGRIFSRSKRDANDTAWSGWTEIATDARSATAATASTWVKRNADGQIYAASYEGSGFSLFSGGLTITSGTVTATGLDIYGAAWIQNLLTCGGVNCTGISFFAEDTTFAKDFLFGAGSHDIYHTNNVSRTRIFSGKTFDTSGPFLEMADAYYGVRPNTVTFFGTSNGASVFNFSNFASVLINGTYNVLHSGNIGSSVAAYSHGHAISDVSGLQGALDGKLASNGTAANAALLDGCGSSVSASASSVVIRDGTGRVNASEIITNVISTLSGGKLDIWAGSKQVEILNTASTSRYLTLSGSPSWGNPTIGTTAGNIFMAESPVPTTNNAFNLGWTSLRWATIYLVNSPNVSSDIRLKEDVREIDREKAVELVRTLAPIEFKRKGSDEINFGFSAQDTKKKLGDGSGRTFGPRALVSHDETNDTWGMLPDQATPVLWETVRGLLDRIEELERKLANGL